MVYFTFQGHLEVKIKMAANINLEKDLFSLTTTMNVLCCEIVSVESNKIHHLRLS